MPFERLSPLSPFIFVDFFALLFFLGLRLDGINFLRVILLVPLSLEIHLASELFMFIDGMIDGIFLSFLGRGPPSGLTLVLVSGGQSKRQAAKHHSFRGLLQVGYHWWIPP